MKKLNFSTKTNIIIGLSVIIVIVITIFFLTRHPELDSGSTSKSPETLTTFPTITTSISTPNKFIWQIDHLQLPSSVNIYSTQPNTQGETILKNLAEKLNFQGEPQIIPNSPLIFYNNSLEATDIYLNTDENLIKYSLNLLEKPIPQNTKTPPITDLLPSNIIKTATYYQVLNGPRFVNSTKDKAKFITTTYNYTLNSLPILFPKGNSIEATHTLSGQLVKLSLNLPPTISSHPELVSGSTSSLPTKTITQIKSTPATEFTTIALTGNQQFQLSDQEINIDTATINNGFLGYIYTQNTLIPHIFLTGTTQDPTYGTIELLLATPATL